MKLKDLFKRTGKATQTTNLTPVEVQITKEDLPRLKKEAEMYAKIFTGLAHYYEVLEIVANSDYYSKEIE